MTAAGDDSAVLAVHQDRVARPRDPGVGERERHELLGWIEVAERVGAYEAGLQLAAPAETGLDRRAVLGQVVAVQVEADLEAERVPRAQPDECGLERVPDLARAIWRDQELDPVLAGVARAA